MRLRQILAIIRKDRSFETMPEVMRAYQALINAERLDALTDSERKEVVRFTKQGILLPKGQGMLNWLD